MSVFTFYLSLPFCDLATHCIIALDFYFVLIETLGTTFSIVLHRAGPVLFDETISDRS